jgi:hypothetical protein
VPEVLPDGSKTPEGIWHRCERDLLEIGALTAAATGTGETGLTIVRNVVGVWQSSGGEVVREALRLYWIDVADTRIAGALLEALADRLGRELEQEVVYVTTSVANSPASQTSGALPSTSGDIPTPGAQRG